MFGVVGLGFGVWGLVFGFRVWRLGFGGLGVWVLRVQVLGFRVWVNWSLEARGFFVHFVFPGSLAL